MPKFRKERAAFEQWFKAFPNADETLLSPDGEGSYCDKYVAGMFGGFCAGWHINAILNIERSPR